MFIPKKGVDIVGDVGIRYEKRLWIESFEFDGLTPRAPLREGYGTKGPRAFTESLSTIYAKAYEDYAAMCSESYLSEENRDGLDIEAYYSNAAEHFVRLADSAESVTMYRKFCGYTENMWRYGSRTMHDVAMEVILPIIGRKPENWDLFYDIITPEFREYIEENNYGKKESLLQKTKLYIDR